MVGRIRILLDSFGENTKSPSVPQVGTKQWAGFLDTVWCWLFFLKVLFAYVDTYVVSYEDGDLMWAKTVENSK